MSIQMDVDHQGHDYCTTTKPAALDLALSQTKDLCAEIARLQKQIEQIAISNKFRLEQFAASDHNVRFYTR